MQPVQSFNFMANSAPQTLSFGGNPAAGIAPSTYNVNFSAPNGVGAQVATSATAGQFNTPATTSSPTPTIPTPSQTQASDVHNGIVAGIAPGSSTPTTNSESTAPSGLQMPTGTAANTTFDAATGQQENPSKVAFDALKGTTPPQDSSSASTAVADATKAATTPPPPPVPPAVTSFLQSETVQQQAADLMQKFMPDSTTTELTNQIAAVNTDKNILAGLNTQLMNINTVMVGTQDDLRSEITAAGGFATESQIDALAVGRNKTLQTQATQLTNQIAAQNQLVANDTSLLTDEKDMASTAFNEQSSVYKMAQDNYNNSLQASQNSLNEVIKSVGYNGLYSSLLQTGGAQAVANAEQVLGLETGQMQGLGTAETAALGSTNIADLLKTYPDAGIQPTDSLAVAQSKVLQSPTYKADLASKNASTNASNASAANSEANTQKTKAETDFENTHGGQTQTEFNAVQQKQADDENAQIEKFQTNAANLIGQLSSKSINWPTAWNQLHAEFPDASNQTIDNALNATAYKK